ncbi:MAG: DUF2723 domain-containing protein [Anaerolineae bacterium]|nr:DUF2723 domain-containing protein [Anaerolineae bacterium]
MMALWAAAGGAWALGLARYLAETFCVAALFSSPWAVGGAAAAGVGAALLAWRVFPTRQAALACAAPALLLPLGYVLSPHPEPLAGLVLLAGGIGVALLGPAGQRPQVLYTAALGVVVLGFYLLTLGRAVGQADTFEFQVVAPVLGIAHPTGYPLYVLLGKLFSWLPLGSMAWRINLTSALAAVAAVLLFHALLQRTIRCQAVALLAALALAFSPLFWSQAVVAEVYALNLAFVAGAMGLIGLLLQDEGGRGHVLALALLLGLGLTHHLTMVLFFPAAGLALLIARPRVGWRTWLGAAACFFLGLAVYAYVPLRWPALHDGQWMSWGELVDYATGRQFGGALQWRLLGDPTRYAIVGRLLGQPFGWAGLLLAAVGVAWLVARQRRLALVSLVAFLPYCLYGLVYQVPDLGVFLLPAHFFLALWMGIGAAALLRQCLRRVPLSPCLLLPLLALLPCSLVWTHLPLVDQSERVAAEQWGRYVLSLPLDEGAAILADGEKFAPLYYLQQVEGLRPDLDLVVHFAEESYRADLAARLEGGQTVYLARYLPRLEGFFLRSLGPLVEVGRSPLAEVPPGATRAADGDGAAIELLSYELQDDPQGRPLHHLTLYWRAAAVPQQDLEVRLRLVDAAGRVAWTSEGARPVGGNYPTNGWSAGAVVLDYYAVPSPPWLAPGSYDLQVALRPRFGGQGQPAGGEAGAWRTLTSLQLGPADGPLDPLPFSRRARIGSAWLAGYDLPATVAAGSPLAVDLAWAGVSGGEEMWLEWQEVAGPAGARQAFVLPPGGVRSRVSLAVPGRPGSYRLAVGAAGGAARCRWLAAAAEACTLATVQVEAAPAGLADFGGLFALLTAEVEGEALAGGEALAVHLRWRALRAAAEDYTVTVQLLGPDGRLYGQVDRWPVQGTLPTSQWSPGQEVDDPYLVPLSPGAPPGRYQVAVGWYLLATMERLPVLDGAGNPVADYVVVGQVEVRSP